MKKLFLTLSLCVLVGTVSFARKVSPLHYVFQKQIIINNQYTCQAFRIHENWFVTAAHCVDMCMAGACQIEILLAQGELNASVRVHAEDIFIPKEYRTVDENQRVSTHKNWDVALIHYRPKEYIYEFPEGGIATKEEFNQALERSEVLQDQWEGSFDSTKIPSIYIYGGGDLTKLRRNLIVPRWNFGQLEYFSNPKTVLYFGQKQALWGADGFGVDYGNSGGAVVLNNGGVIGVATAKMDNQLPREVRQAFPTFGQAKDFFLFNGFAPETTLKFIKRTMAHYGDYLLTKELRGKLRPVSPVIEPSVEPVK